MSSHVTLKTLFAAAAVTGLGLVVPTATAQAGTSGAWYYQQARVGGGVGSYAHFGSDTDTVLVGDWDGDGRDSWAVRRGNTFYVTNSPAGGATAYTFVYGSPGDAVLVGDWDGDGKDTLGVRRGNTYYLTDNPRGGAANRVFSYGAAADPVLTGDWNGDGRDTLGVRRGNRYYLTNAQGGSAQTVATFGSAGDVVLTGDWNADRRDTLGVRRGNTYYLANSVTGGRTDVTQVYGTPEDSTYVGDWDGDRTDTLAVRRAVGPTPSFPGTGTFVVGSQVASGLYKSSAPAAGCYWERDKDFSGTAESINANDFPFDAAPIYAEITSADAGFYTEGCGTWVMASPTDAPRYVTPRNGQFRVGWDIPSGRYRAPGGESCYWARLAAFRGDVGSVVANGLGDAGPVVDVLPGDAGLESRDCGSWTRIGDAQPTAAKQEGRRVAPRDVAATAELARRHGLTRGR